MTRRCSGRRFAPPLNGYIVETDGTMDPQVATLGLKLLETLHLSVPERRSLPTRRSPVQCPRCGCCARLDAKGWFPVSLGGGSEMWIGARLEKRGAEFWVHERYEAGVGRVGPIRSPGV